MSSQVIRGDWAASEVEAYQTLTAGAWESRHEQLSPGAFGGRLRFSATPAAVVYREHFGAACRVRGALRPGLVGWAVAGGAARERGLWWGAGHPDGSIPYGSGGCEIDMVFPTGCDNTLALMEEARFRRQFGILAGQEPDFLDRRGNFVALRPQTLETLERSLQALIDLDGADGAAVGQDALETRVVEALVDAVARPIRIWMTRSQKRGLVDRAFGTAAASRFSLSVADLCLRLRTSRRTLEYAFHECLGLSPSAYLKLRRLNLCRIRLARADPAAATVRDVVARTGFRDSGRFAAEYRAHFGEFPSETLHRRVRPAPQAFRLEL